MRTMIKEYIVYMFDELSEEAKQTAYEEYIRDREAWYNFRDVFRTASEIEKLFKIDLGDWCIDTYQPKYPSVRFLDNFGDLWEQEERRRLKGNRARAFLWNNFGHVLLEPRHHYYYRDASGKYCAGIADNSVKYVSKMSFDRVYDGSCPLTGMYFDCCALDPLASFCFGVEWDEEKKCRTMTTDRTIANDDRTTVEDVIRECVRSMFKAFIDDLEDAESREHFEETCDVNGWEFLESGEMA